jgi:hypothetical protein
LFHVEIKTIPKASHRLARPPKVVLRSTFGWLREGLKLMPTFPQSILLTGVEIKTILVTLKGPHKVGGIKPHQRGAKKPGGFCSPSANATN